MPVVTFVPDNISIAIEPDMTLREAAHLAGVEVYDRCGGTGSCCNCVVTIVEGAEHCNAKTFVEEAVTYLEPADRLSCQCTISGKVVAKTLG